MPEICLIVMKFILILLKICESLNRLQSFASNLLYIVMEIEMKSDFVTINFSGGVIAS